MIVRSAVKIYDKKQNKEIIIPCHRHCDAFQILKDFGYSRQDYQEIEQGFLDEEYNFLDRTDAWLIAKNCSQLLTDSLIHQPLYSEDIW